MSPTSPGIPISPATTSAVVRKLRSPLSKALGGAMSKATAATTPSVAGTAPSQAAAAAAAAGASTAAPVATPPISQADFMQILVTQLQNQDPMNPLQPDQLASQLAQFTTVQELASLNTDASNQLSAVTSNTQAIEANMATSLIGRPVIAAGNQVDVSSSSSSTSVMADIGGSGGQGVLTLINAQGQTVGTYKLGTLNGGTHQILSFNTAGVTPGAYNYSLSVTAGSGAAVPVTTYVAGVVTGVNFSTATPTLDIGDLSTPISNLVEVLPNNVVGGASSTSQEKTKQ
jgi:flagellar basal-body rod modification protein FlgD